MTAKRVVLVAESGPLRETTHALLQRLPGVAVYCADDLSTGRAVCRADGDHAAPLSLVLVELQRCQGNGFSLAATLGRELSCPIALLSDRNDQADPHWARSRGIAYCWSRLAGTETFLNVISKALAMQHGGDNNMQERFSERRVNPCVARSALLAKTRRAKTQAPNTQAPNTQTSKAQTPRTQPDMTALKNRVLVTNRAREKLAALLSESELFFKGSVNGDPEGGKLASSQAWFFALGLLDPELADMLVENGEKAMTSRLSLLRWECLQALKIPAAATNHPGRQLHRGATSLLAWQACEVIRNELLAGIVQLMYCRKSSDQERLRQQVLMIAISLQELAPKQLPLRWLGFLPELLVHLAASQHALVEEEMDHWLWFSQRLSIGKAVRYERDSCKVCGLVQSAATEFSGGILGSVASTWQALLKRPGTKGCCANLLNLLSQITPAELSGTDTLNRQVLEISETLYQLMVCAALDAGEQGHAWQYIAENLLLRSLYQSSRNLIWHERGEREACFWQLIGFLQCLRSPSGGDQDLMTRCLGFEVRLSRAVRFKAMQHRLSSGLHLLPRPDLIASSLLQGETDPAALVSDLQIELNHLISGAERLGVTWVGALSYALLQALLLSSGDEFCMADRRLVVRGLYRLCRMLDQAAAWRRVSAASGSVERLLQLRFGHNDSLCGQQGPGKGPGTLPRVSEFGPVCYGQVADIKDKQKKCQLLNRLIKGVLEEQKLQSGAASVLGRLINEQARLLRDAFSP